MKLKLTFFAILMMALIFQGGSCLGASQASMLASSLTSFSGVGSAVKWSDVGPGPILLEAGYLADSGGVSLNLDLKGDGGLDIEDLSMDLGLSGVLLGLTCPAFLGDLGKISVSGVFTIPFEMGAQERFSNLGAPVTQRINWESLSKRTNVQGMWEIPVRDTVNVLLGFRYEAWDVSFMDPTGPAAVSGADGEMEVDLYIPLVGLMMDLGPVTFGATALPTLPGAISYGETKGSGKRLDLDSSFSRGHWAEVWVRYSPVVFEIGPMDTGIGILGTFSSAFGGAEPTAELFAPNQAGPADIGIYDMSLYRRIWTIGVTTSISF